MGAQEINRAVKQLVRGVLEDQSLTDLFYGTVTAGGVRLDDKPLEIDWELLDLPEHLKEYQVKVSGEMRPEDDVVMVEAVDGEGRGVQVQRIVLNKALLTVWYEKLLPGDRVIVVRKQGGQRYAVIDKLQREG